MIESYFGFIALALVWLGTLIFWTGKMSSSDKKNTEQLLDIKEDIKTLHMEDKEILRLTESIIKENSKYNEEHFVSKTSHDNCKEQTERRLLYFESLNLGATLATIQTHQQSMSTQLTSIQKTLEQLRRDMFLPKTNKISIKRRDNNE